MNKEEAERLYAYSRKILEELEVVMPAYRTIPDMIDRVLFNPPATIIFWKDGTKTVVKADPDEDPYIPYLGFCAAIVKKIFGTNSSIKKILKERSNYQEIPECIKEQVVATVIGCALFEDENVNKEEPK